MCVTVLWNRLWSVVTGVFRLCDDVPSRSFSVIRASQQRTFDPFTDARFFFFSFQSDFIKCVKTKESCSAMLVVTLNKTHLKLCADR